MPVYHRRNLNMISALNSLLTRFINRTACSRLKITKNHYVTIYISKGEDPEGTIPNVVEMTEVDA